MGYDLAPQERENNMASKPEETSVFVSEIFIGDIGIPGAMKTPSQAAVDRLDSKIQQLNVELERYTLHAEKEHYALAVACGIISGAIDAIFVGETKVLGDDIGNAHKEVNDFIKRFANKQGIESKHLKNTVSRLEEMYPTAQDSVWRKAGDRVGIPNISNKNHHLADLAHHPTPLGLLSSIMVQLFGVATFVSKDGKWHFRLVKPEPGAFARVVFPAIITGVLNWLVAIAKNNYEAETGKELPKAIGRLAHLVASTPIIIEIARCANNWFGHLVSDMAGSKNTAGGGMGIPGVFLSLFYEIAALPPFKNTGLPRILNDLYEKQKFDLRHELAYFEKIMKQAIPVVINEIATRVCFMVIGLVNQFQEHKDLRSFDWQRIIPFANRTVDRMLTVSTMTFSIVDAGDAAIRAAVESGCNWVLFSSKFVARYNFVGAGRVVVAIVKEVYNENKEAQLIHEKRLLMEDKAEAMYAQLQEFKALLDAKVTEFLIENISAFLKGFDDINAGLATNNSNLVIQGNVTIQQTLGREAQFTTQNEFDDLMGSDVPLEL